MYKKLCLYFTLLAAIVSYFIIGCKKENHPPVINSIKATPDTVALGDSAILSVTANDIDGDSITFNWSAPAGTLSASEGDTVIWRALNVNSGVYSIQVIAVDERNAADTANINVEVMTPLSFEDNFESYSSGEYPSSGGWYQLFSGDSINTNVISGVSHNGDKSFKLSGYPNWVRADGKNLDISIVDNLTYEFSIMIPTGSITGGLAGFFVRISASESREYNLVQFCFGGDDSVVVVKGTSAIRTSFVWNYDTWYSVKV